MSKKKEYLRASLIEEMESLFKFYKDDFQTIQKSLISFGFYFSISEIKKLYKSYKKNLGKIESKQKKIKQIEAFL